MANNYPTAPAATEKRATRRAAPKPYAFFVASGIFISRVAGLIRDRVFAHYFGNSDAADAFKAAFRIPNFLQNLFGEGVLSASFIPVYARLLAGGDEQEARRTAGAVAALLALTTSVLVLLGVLATPLLIDAIAPGFSGAKRELTIRLVRILFPGAGLLVISAWCLGILNSHRRFFLSYTAPVVWNAAMITTLLVFGGSRGQYPLAWILAWGSVAGSALQVGVQLPSVLKLLRRLQLNLDFQAGSVRTVIRNFFPVFLGRGVVQISAYVDALLASLLPTGAVAALAYAQTLYTLPVSLFGMAVSAAELPLMSGEMGDREQVAAALRVRLDAGLRRIAFFVVPSAAAFLVLGDVVVAAIYQTGQFTRSDVLYVWSILAGATVGLLPSTCGRLYASAYYALRDTRTPLRFAVVRVALTIVLGYFFALRLPAALGIAARWGGAGLTVSAGIAGWVEFLLLRRSLVCRVDLSVGFQIKLWAAAFAAAGIGWGVRAGFGHHAPILTAMVVLAPYGLAYFGIARILGIAEARDVLRYIRRR